MTAAEVVSIILVGVVVLLLYFAVEGWLSRVRDEDGPWWTPWR